MADLLEFSVVRNGTVSLPNAPTWLINGKIVDSATQQTVLRDFTGANAISFPQALANLTAAQMNSFVEAITLELIRRRFPELG